MNATVTIDDHVESWMNRKVHSVHRDASVRDVLEIMAKEVIASVPVVGEKGEVVGIVTLGDLARVVLSTEQVLDSDFPHYEDCFWAVDLFQRRLGSDPVLNVMSENVTCVRPDQSMREAALIMIRDRIRHLAVVDERGLVGMLAAIDFVRLIAKV
ncbi:CBS domain-containing protein [Roseiconus nitratireducens]|nr:CBS domain-containing protein [Roseiconus nitratireducens]